MKRELATGAMAVAVLTTAVVVLAIVRPETFWNLDGKDLADSIGGKADYAVLRPCQERSEGEWRCPLDLDPGSGWSETAHVTVDDERCWVATAPHSERLTGCVGFVAYLPLPDLTDFP